MTIIGVNTQLHYSRYFPDGIVVISPTFDSSIITFDDTTITWDSA